MTLFICGCLLTFSHTQAASPQYTVEDLGGPPEVVFGGMDAEGNVVGDWKGQAARLTPHLVSLGTLPGGTWAHAYGSDGRYGVVGVSATGVGGRWIHAFLSRNGHMRDLGALDGPEQQSAANALNAFVIVGYSTMTGDPVTPEPVAWRMGGGPPIRLATLGGKGGSIQAVTASGVAVGGSQTVTGESHATMWIGGFPTDLTLRPGITSWAAGINESLMVVGAEDTGYAFRWTPQHGLEMIAPLPGDMEANLVGVNASGVAVGYSLIAGEGARAMRVSGSETVDLNTLILTPGWVLGNALRISDHGDIAGEGWLNGVAHIFVLHPLPGAVAKR
jgi:uncharacterized membrane protein